MITKVAFRAILTFEMELEETDSVSEHGEEFLIAAALASNPEFDVDDMELLDHHEVKRR
jgi:hypothetical protein